MSNKMSIKFLVKILFPYFCSMGPENLLSLFICLSILMSRIKGVFVYQLKNEKSNLSNLFISNLLYKTKED